MSKTKTKPAEAPAEVTETASTEPSPEYGREVWRLVKRWRKQALPLAAIGATHGVGAAAASLAGPAAAVPVLAGSAGAAGAAGYAWNRTSMWGRIYASVAAASSTVGQTAVAVDGGTGTAAGMVWAAGCALAVPWWVKHCEPDPDVTAENDAYNQATSTAVVTADSQQRRKLWDEHIAVTNGALPNSTLTRITGFAYGWKATATLPVGRHWHDVMNARKAILSVYDLPDGRVFVEAVPSDSVRKARITVLTSDPLQSITRWSQLGLDPKRGTVPLMTTADGELLNWRFWWPGEGACHGLLSGVNGSGKTTVLDLLLTEAAASDRVVPFVVDGGGGASLPQWQHRVKMFAETPGDARTLLTYLLRLMDQRRKVLKKQRRNGGGGSLEPSPDMPLLLCAIDEAHKLLMNDADTGTDNSDVKRMCEKLTQEGRKFGIALVLSTQVPSATQLGGSTVLRDQLKGGTVVGLRVTERTSGNMITSGAPMPEQLHELPAEFPDGKPTKGLGYVLTSRMIRARSLLIAPPDEQPTSLWRDTPLDAACAAENVPVLDGVPDDEDDDGEQPNRSSGSDEQGDDAVVHALADGCAKNPIAVMQATGLTMSQARAALKRVDA